MTQNQTEVRRQKPQIPSLGPNLGKLGFTDLKNDDSDNRNNKHGDTEMKNEQSTAKVAQPAFQPPAIQQKKPGMPMGLGLNLANVKREIDEQPASQQVRPVGVPTMNLSNVPRTIDT